MTRHPSEPLARFRNRLRVYHRRRELAIYARRTLDRAPVHLAVWIAALLVAALVVAAIARNY